LSDLFGAPFLCPASLTAWVRRREKDSPALMVSWLCTTFIPQSKVDRKSLNPGSSPRAKRCNAEFDERPTAAGWPRCFSPRDDHFTLKRSLSLDPGWARAMSIVIAWIPKFRKILRIFGNAAEWPRWPPGA
jgi:hypothetical protein